MNHDQQDRAALQMIALDLERLKRMAEANDRLPGRKMQQQGRHQASCHFREMRKENSRRRR